MQEYIFALSSAFFLFSFTYIIVKNEELNIDYLKFFITIFLTSVAAYFAGMESSHIKSYTPDDLKNYEQNLIRFILIPYYWAVASLTLIMAAKTKYYKKSFHIYKLGILRKSKFARYRLVIGFQLIIISILLIELA
jgi:hypothetical protein